MFGIWCEYWRWVVLIKCGMFVRCPIDNEKYPRDYAIGKVKSIDEFSELVDVEFNDVTGISVFYPKPENKQYNINAVSNDGNTITGISLNTNSLSIPTYKTAIAAPSFKIASHILKYA